MARYWTSDLHLGHKNIIEYCLRPFADKDIMTDAIILMLTAKLKKGDELIVVGDVSLRPKYAFELGKLLTALGVKLTLVMGNHDSAHPCNTHNKEKLAKQVNDYRECGWDLHLHWETKLSDGTFVVVSHMPYGTDSGMEYDKRYQEYRLKDQGATLIHGHLHGRYKKYGRMIDVGYDAHAGQILSEDELIALIHDPRERINCELTEYYAERKASGQEKTGMKGL